MKELRLAELTCHLRGGTDGNGGGTGPLVILLHGFGASGTDLVDLADMIPAPEGTRFLFPEAPIELSALGPFPPGARAWWLLDMIGAQVAMMTGDMVALAESLRPGLDEALCVAARFLAAVREQLEPNPSRIIFGGFSQGAILSLEAALNHDAAMGGLLLFSASLLDSAEVRRRAVKLGPMRAVVSHGRQDPILPFQLGEDLAEALTSAGWQAEWVAFDGGHGIAPEALAQAERLLFNQLAAQSVSAAPQ